MHTRCICVARQKNEKIRAKDVLPKTDRTQPAEITTGSNGMIGLLLRDVICSQRVPFRRCRG